jgi:hypothetical protein
MVEPTSKISEENHVFREPAELWISEKEEIPIDPYSLFILAIRSPVTRAKYLQRLGYFLDFLEIPKSDDYGSIISFENRINGCSCSTQNHFCLLEKLPFVIGIYNNRNTSQSLKNNPTIHPCEYQLGISTTLRFFRKKHLSRTKESMDWI